MASVKAYGFQFTKEEYDCLLELRKKPRNWSYLKKYAKTDDVGMNIMLSDLKDMYYIVEDDKDIRTGTLKLNQIGITVAQAEFDRRFDMYYTRAMSFAGLLVSVAAIIISLAK